MSNAPDLIGTALYRFFNADNDLIYIGVTKTLLRRLYQHESLSPWMAELHHVAVVWYSSRQAALEAETAAIRTENPKYNQKGLPKPKPEPKSNLKPALPTALAKRKEQSLAAMEREIVQGVKSLEVAQFFAMYTVNHVSMSLGISPEIVNWLIEKKVLGHVVLHTPSGQERIRITGWQYLDFLEFIQQHGELPKWIREADENSQ